MFFDKSFLLPTPSPKKGYFSYSNSFSCNSGGEVTDTQLRTLQFGYAAVMSQLIC